MIHPNFTVIGYAGHAYVVCGILQSNNITVTAYCDTEEKECNPFNLAYLGTEFSEKALDTLAKGNFFIAIGNNIIRKKIFESLAEKKILSTNAIHTSAIISPTVSIAANAVMVSAGVIINPLAKISTGVICNTACIIEHECIVKNFAHIGPGAVLCGNVTVGENTFVGAGAIIRQGITIGENVMVGAGAVVVKNVPNNAIIKGNPAR